MHSRPVHFWSRSFRLCARLHLRIDEVRRDHFFFISAVDVLHRVGIDFGVRRSTWLVLYFTVLYLYSTNDLAVIYLGTVLST
jgi:hypothetical protein